MNKQAAFFSRFLLPLLMLLFLLSAPFAQAQEDTTIIVASDLHYISPKLTDHGAYFTRMIAAGDGKIVQYCEEIVEALISEVIAAKPDCLILPGDVTFNGARQSHEDLAQKLMRVREAGIPVYVLPGNHDMNNYNAASFSGDSFTRLGGISPEEFASIYAQLGFSDALSRDPASLSYIAEPVCGLRILMLDVNYPWDSNAVSEQTFLWLEEQLADARAAGAKVSSVTHQNIYAHNSLLSYGYVIRNAELLRALYDQYGVRLNLSGHMHMQHIIEGSSGLCEIASSSLLVSPCQYGIIRLSGSRGTYRTQKTDVAGWARAKGLEDDALLRFPEYADAFFRATSLGQSEEMLSGAENTEEMIQFLCDVNAAYFAGRPDLIEDRPDMLRAWAQTGTFFGEYLISILREKIRSHTALDFSL